MTKKIIIGTIAGFILGVVCYLIGAKVLGFAFTNVDIAATVFNRVLIGFFIAVTAWNINRYGKAALISFLISIHVAIKIFDTTGLFPAVMFCIVGSIYGMLIEFVIQKFSGASQR